MRRPRQAGGRGAGIASPGRHGQTAHREPSGMTTDTPHIAVCICTYKRPQMLGRLLRGLAEQETEGRFTYSIVVADNDRQESAKAVTTAFAAASRVPIRYCV